jgi:hypothetical protein
MSQMNARFRAYSCYRFWNNSDITSCSTSLRSRKSSGLLSTAMDWICLVMATEFGRSPKLSKFTAGRGHHPAVFTWWVAGGGMKGGFVYGQSDEAGERVDENAVEHSPSGRRFTVADQGQPVIDLFA